MSGIQEIELKFYCFCCRPEDLRIPFERYGPVKDVYLPKNYYTGYFFLYHNILSAFDRLVTHLFDTNFFLWVCLDGLLNKLLTEGINKKIIEINYSIC